MSREYGLFHMGLTMKTTNINYTTTLALVMLGCSCGGEQTTDTESAGDQGSTTDPGTTTAGTDSDTSGVADTTGVTEGTDTANETIGSEGSTQSVDTGDSSATSGSSGDATNTTGADTTSTSSGDATSTSSEDSTTTTGTVSVGESTTESWDGCKKIDFLFVVDNSISMEDEQTALTAAFPEFMSTIMTEVSGEDHHVMVVDTDAEGECTPTTCSAPPPAYLSPTCEGPTGHACTATFEQCDYTRGAGVVHPAGEYASNTLCMPYGGNRYIIDGEPDLSGTFSCMATVGTAGSPSERPLQAIIAALSEDLQEPGGCNEGFLRHGALLVITFISDDFNNEDIKGGASAQTTFDAILAAKYGVRESIVVLGLIPETGQQHWKDFIAMYDARGIEGPITAANYDDFFQNAVMTIDKTCDELPPPS